MSRRASKLGVANASATERAKLRRGAWNRSHLCALKSVLPALLPGKIGRKDFLKVFPAQEALKSPTGGHVADNQDPLTLPSERQIGEKTSHPVCCLAPTLTAGVRQIEVRAPITMNLGSGCAVQLTVVALPEPPVLEDRYGRACKGHLHCLNGSLQVRHEDGRQPVVATPLAEHCCIGRPSVGETARKPSRGYPLLIVLSG